MIVTFLASPALALDWMSTAETSWNLSSSGAEVGVEVSKSDNNGLWGSFKFATPLTVTDAVKSVQYYDLLDQAHLEAGIGAQWGSPPGGVGYATLDGAVSVAATAASLRPTVAIGARVFEWVRVGGAAHPLDIAPQLSLSYAHEFPDDAAPASDTLKATVAVPIIASNAKVGLGPAFHLASDAQFVAPTERVELWLYGSPDLGLGGYNLRLGIAPTGDLAGGEVSYGITTELRMSTTLLEF